MTPQSAPYTLNLKPQTLSPTRTPGKASMASACKAKAQLADASVGPEMETTGLRLGEAEKKEHRNGLRG